MNKVTMNNLFKSRWFKFILRTLVDWAALVLLFLLAGVVRTIVDPPRCYYSHRDWQIKQSILDNYEIIIDTVNGEDYYIAVDTVHNYKFSTGFRFP